MVLIRGASWSCNYFLAAPILEHIRYTAHTHTHTHTHTHSLTHIVQLNCCAYVHVKLIGLTPTITMATMCVYTSTGGHILPNFPSIIGLSKQCQSVFSLSPFCIALHDFNSTHFFDVATNMIQCCHTLHPNHAYLLCLTFLLGRTLWLLRP